MKKNFKFYLLLWTILLVLFNVISFISPGWSGHEKYTLSFWIGYVCITAAFIGQLACAHNAFKAENLSKLFYNIPLITISFTGLIISFIVGGLCMLISPLPHWVGVILCAVVLALTAISIAKAGFAAEAVSAVDEKIKSGTLFIKSLTTDAEHLMNTAKMPEIKAECKKVYDAIRYSDPMSNAMLVEEEAGIKKIFTNFAAVVKAGNPEEISYICSELLSLIDLRNKKCKLLK